MGDELAGGGQGRPTYLVVRDEVRQGIEDGTYPVGSAIPSENDLAARFGTTRQTARGAVDGLVAEGLVRRVQGKGAYVVGGVGVASRPPQGFRAQHRQRMRAVSVRIIGHDLREAGPYYARVFGVGEDETLVRLRRLNLLDGEPYCLTQTVISCLTVPGIELVDCSVLSLYEAYAQLGHPVARAREELGLSTLAARDARHLGVEAGTPALVVRGVSYDAEGLALEYSVTLIPEDRASYTVRF